jgi:hypothetical protein
MVEPKKLKYREDAKDGTHKKGDTFTAFDLILDDGSKYGTFSEADAQAAAPLIGKGVRLVYKVNGAYRNFVSIHAG